MFKKFYTLGLFVSAFILSSPAFAQERITITTYYPSPIGIYRELRSNRMSIGENYLNRAIPANSLIVEGQLFLRDFAPDDPTIAMRIGTTSGVELLFKGRTVDAPIRNNANIESWTNNSFYIGTRDPDNTGGLDGGSIQFHIGNPNTATANPRLAIGSNGNVGIGSPAPTSPEATLQINRAVTTLGDGLKLYKASDADQNWLSWAQGSQGSGSWRMGYTGFPYDLKLSVGSLGSLGTEVMRWTATGDVGIGFVAGSAPAAPTAKLHVFNGGFRHGWPGEINIDSNNVVGGRMKIMDNSVVPAKDGFVGIGYTTDPAYKLDVNGDIRAKPWLRTVASSGCTVSTPCGVGEDNGWYSDSYGGGWYMQDANWIRSYNGKSVFTGSGVVRADGGFQVGEPGQPSAKFQVNLNGDMSLGGTNIDIAFQKIEVFNSAGTSLGKHDFGVFHAKGINTLFANDGTYYWTRTRTGSQYTIYMKLESNGKLKIADALEQASLMFDISENIPVKQKDSIEAGDVVIVDPEADEQVKISDIPYDTKVAGIISAKPAILLGADFEDKLVDDKKPLVLAGRAPCKVTAENGPINRGDLLVTSSKPGYAMKADPDKLKFGMILGKALEPLEKGEGKILVLVNVN